jgi:phospholipid N-methyltransferase
MSSAATGRGRPLRPSHDRLAILTAFLRHPARTGTIAPSSRDLARAMVGGLELEPDQTVVEFGPGPGRSRPRSRILPSPPAHLGVEIEPRLRPAARERYPELRVVEGSAEHAPRYLAESGRGRVKAVISGLPFASLPPAVQDGIIRSFDALVGPGAEIRTFQYVHSLALPTTARFLRRMQAVFGPHARHALVLRNLPPAVVLRWVR